MKKLLLLFALALLASGLRADITLDAKCTKVGPFGVRISQDQGINVNQAVLKTDDGETVTLTVIPLDTVKLSSAYKVKISTSGPGTAVQFLGGEEKDKQVAPTRQARGVTKTAEVIEEWTANFGGTEKPGTWKVNIQGLAGEDIKALSQTAKYFLKVELQ